MGQIRQSFGITATKILKVCEGKADGDKEGNRAPSHGNKKSFTCAANQKPGLPWKLLTGKFGSFEDIKAVAVKL